MTRPAVVGFARPHTVVGTVVSVCALFVLAHALPTPAPPTLAGLASALVAGLGVNVYIVGLNQLTDVELDRVNKPWLPLPAGLLSRPAASRLVVASLAVALAAAALGSGWLLLAIVLAAALGTAYSAPPLRLKRHHALAAACIVGVRGLVVNLLVYAHLALPAGEPARFPPAVVALTTVVVVVGLAIAWLKDLADMEGDRRHAVGTLPLRLGPRRVVALGVGALLVTDVAVVAAALAGIPGLDGRVMAAGHAGLAALTAVATVRLRLGEARSVARFYRSVWHVFYAEYAIFALAALLAPAPPG